MLVSEVIVEDRVRKDMGNIDELTSSIKEYGLIEPIVIGRDHRLIAGERRLRALTALGLELQHGIHYIFNDELDELRRKAMEVEENVKRKELSWSEQVLAKQRLLAIMQQLHGVATSGRPSVGVDPGFGVNKLAAMLGESNAQTSKDLELASFLTIAPELRKAETKEAARRQAVLAVAVAHSIQKLQAQSAPNTEQKWKLYEGPFEQQAPVSLGDASIDLLIVDPPYGEDVQGMAANSRQLLAQAFVDSRNETAELYRRLSREAFRVLHPDTFAVFFFGYDLYAVLLDALQTEGFTVDTTPLVWVKNTVINTSPYTRYGRSYEPILIARKGEPKLIRPGQRDVISDIQNVESRSVHEQKVYQAQKPVALIEKFILDMSIPGQTICDFCAGSGTTGVAALRLGRRVVLFEKDPIACLIIKSRLGATP